MLAIHNPSKYLFSFGTLKDSIKIFIQLFKTVQSTTYYLRPLLVHNNCVIWIKIISTVSISLECLQIPCNKARALCLLAAFFVIVAFDEVQQYFIRKSLWIKQNVQPKWKGNRKELRNHQTNRADKCPSIINHHTIHKALRSNRMCSSGLTVDFGGGWHVCHEGEAKISNGNWTFMVDHSTNLMVETFQSLSSLWLYCFWPFPFAITPHSLWIGHGS